jgi:hypothetical protein
VLRCDVERHPGSGQSLLREAARNGSGSLRGDLDNLLGIVGGIEVQT